MEFRQKFRKFDVLEIKPQQKRSRSNQRIACTSTGSNYNANNNTNNNTNNGTTHTNKCKCIITCTHSDACSDSDNVDRRLAASLASAKRGIGKRQ